MIQVLKNECSLNYQHLKRTVLSSQFPWTYNYSTYETSLPEGHCALPFYSHEFLMRPETKGYPFPNSNLLDLNLKVLGEILNTNKVFSTYYFLRSNANATHPDIGPQFSQPHLDHTYPHANLIVYLSGDGPTYVDGEKYEFEEDDAILFYGPHFQERPKKDRRVVLVATLMGFETLKQD